MGLHAVGKQDAPDGLDELLARMELEMRLSKMAGNMVNAEFRSTLRELEEAERWADGVVDRKRAGATARTTGRRVQAATAPNPVRDATLADYDSLLASGKTEREARSKVHVRAALGTYGLMPKTGNQPKAKTVNDWLRKAKNTHPT